MREAVLGVDVGTSSLKAGLLTLDGQELAPTRRVSYATSSPEPGAMEQDAADWWRALASASRELLETVGDSLQVHVLAVAVGGQAPTLCAADADLRPTHAALTWLDQRVAAEAERMYTALGVPVPPWGSWPAQLAWLARHRPAALGRTRWVFGCPDYLLARLTGRPVLSLAWPAEELAAAGIDAALLPPLVDPGNVVGPIVPAAAQATGLPAGTPVVAGFVDGIMGVLGSGVRQRGDACMNSGTSGTFSILSPAGVGYPVLDLWVHGGATNTSGKALDWFAEQIASIRDTYDDLLAGAAEVPPGALGLLFLPHLAGERAPVADARSRGAWVGLTLQHDRRHLLRSVLEGVALNFRALAESLTPPGTLADVYCVGGQARSALWNQIKADVLNRPVLVPSVVDAAVVGAAILAALGLEAYSSHAEAVSAMVHVAGRFDPDGGRAATYDALYAAFSELYPKLRDTSSRLSAAARTGRLM